MRKAKRILNVPPYLFARIEKTRNKLLAEGKDLVDLGVGDPDSPTPDFILKDFHKIIDDPKTHDYPPYNGIPEFRASVAKWYKKRFNVDLDPETEVLSLIGSKEGIAHIFYAFIDPGDVALLTDPGYPVYNTGTILAGGSPYPVPILEENGFLPDLKSIDKKALKKAKLLFINYPNNPTAAVATKEFFTEAVEFCKKNDLLLCSDLAYSEVAFDGFRPMSILEIPGAKDVAIEFHSLSKTYNMTGWRIGMAVGNSEAISALSIIKTNTDSGIFKAIQLAAVTALESSGDNTAKMNKIYQKRRDIIVDGLNSLGWDIKKPKATFYIWAKVPKSYTSEKFTEELLKKAGVLIVPGSGYGKYGEGYFRMSITLPEKRLEEAISRMRAANIKFN
ncbi:LL-diaminopimelate aminotransferase [Candidatus Margulisiibacteriota bacterium]